jgi:hypothetical protein
VHLLCPSSGVFYCTFGTGKFHAGFDGGFQAESGWNTSSICYMCLKLHPYYPPSCDNIYSRPIWWELQTTKLLIMQFSPFSCHFHTLRLKYLPEHPVLANPRFTFLPLIKTTVWKRSSKTCMKLTSAECTVENSWWRAEKMSETCRVLWQNKLG